MWELLLEFDYQTIRHALLAGYLLTFILPLAAFFILTKQQSHLNDKYHASLHSDHSKTTAYAGNVIDWHGAQRIFTYIRQKDSPDDCLTN